MGLRKLAPETRDARRVGRARPSRSRPWLAVTVPETAGDERCGGSVTGVGPVTEAWDLHASVRVVQLSRPRCSFYCRYSHHKSCSAFSGLLPRPEDRREAKGSVT